MYDSARVRERHLSTRWSRRLVVSLLLAMFPLLPAVAEDDADHAMGLELLDESSYRSIPLASTPLMGDLPPKVDLSKWFPEPGDQGAQSSCVGWAVAYGLKTYQEAKERSWRPNEESTKFSPSYIYNQIKQSSGCEGGTTFVEALNLLRREGVATLAQFPYNESDCSTHPSSAIKQGARAYAISDWRRVNVQDETEIKTQLAAGFPVLIGMVLDSEFHRGPAVYDRFSGENLGGHAMVVTGYDDDRQAFRVFNSWGTSWGYNGSIWVTYRAFRQAVREALVVQDIIVDNPSPAPNNDTEPEPTPQPVVLPEKPKVNLGVPEIAFNIPIRHEAGLPPGLGFVVTLPGEISASKGRELQMVVRIFNLAGQPLLANPREPAYRDAMGMVATGSGPPRRISSDEVDLSQFRMSMPYYALNFGQTGIPVRYELMLSVSIYLDGFLVAQTTPVRFFVVF